MGETKQPALIIQLPDYQRPSLHENVPPVLKPQGDKEGARITLASRLCLGGAISTRKS